MDRSGDTGAAHVARVGSQAGPELQAHGGSSSGEERSCSHDATRPRLREHGLAEGEALIPREAADKALAEGGRFAIINVWRNIESVPVATHPLALCDGQTVEPDELVVFEIHMPDRVGENYWAKYDERHTFYCYPGMTRDEALLIKQWDSAGLLARSGGAQADHEAEGPCTFSFHSAFHDPDTPEDAPDRWSIEVRCVVVY